MDTSKLDEIINLAKKHGLGELRYQDDELKVKIVMPGQSNLADNRIVPQTTQQVPTNTQPSTLKNDVQEVESGLIPVKSPLVGTFYASPSPGAEPFTRIGEVVSPGQTIAIIEAMKIMNEIDAEVSGEVAKICVENEDIVEFGQILFYLKPKSE